MIHPWRKKGSKQQTKYCLLAQRHFLQRDAFKTCKRGYPVVAPLCLKNKTKQNFGIEEKHLQWINQCLDKLFLRERYFGLKAQSSVAMFFSCAYHPPSTSTSLRGKREITEERGEGNGVIKFLHAFISAYADNLPVCCTFNHTFSTPQK